MKYSTMELLGVLVRKSPDHRPYLCKSSLKISNLAKVLYTIGYPHLSKWSSQHFQHYYHCNTVIFFSALLAIALYFH